MRNFYKITTIVLAVILLLVAIFPFAITTIPRKNAIGITMNWYVQRGGQLPVIETPHFTDISDCTPEQILNIEQAFELGFTAGTGNTTFSPNARTWDWQWMIFVGKMSAATQP